MKAYFLATLLLFSTITQAQNTKPKITSEKGLKETITKIKKGLPDIKKNLTTKDKYSDDHYPNVKLGSGAFYRETDKDQSLTFSYFSSGYSGTVEDYQNHYKTLVSTIKEIFGSEYTAKTTEKEKKWTTAFYENGKDAFNSPTRIYIKCDWILASTPSISIEVWSRIN